MHFTHTDATVGELTVSRTFNTGRVADSTRYGSFGPGWNASFELRLISVNPKILAARLRDGAPQYYFDDHLDGTYSADLPYSKATTLQAIASGHKRLFRAGGEEVYDSAGRIVSATDAAGVTTTYTRDGQNRLTSMTKLGRSLTITYSGTSPQPYQLLGPGAAVLATYTYDASNRLETVAYPDGSGYRYFYDAGHRIVRVDDAAGKTLETHTYDGQGRALTSQTADGVDGLLLSYGSNQTVVTDSLGNAATYDFQTIRGIPRMTKVTGPCAACGGGSGDTQEWTYDYFGNVTSYKDGDGKVTTYTYDADGNRLTETDPLNHTTTYTYDSLGRVLTVRAADTGLTTMTQGSVGPLTVKDGVDRTTVLTYNAKGKVETITDPRNETTTLSYDATTADLLSVTDPLNHATTFGYDSFGRRTTVTNALNHTTTTAYDSRGRVTRITLPDGTYTEFTYDTSGNRTSVIDPLGRATRYIYDQYRRLEEVVDPANGVTRYQYDLMSNLISLTDAKGQTTRFEYDLHNRVKAVTYPGGGTEAFTYDNVGRLKTRTDRKNVVTTYTYDAAGHLTGKTYSDATPAVTFTYDDVGRLKTAANGTDTLTWTYDLAGQLLSEQSSRNASTVAYTYDGAGNRLTVTLNGTLHVGYGYDDASRLTAITRGAATFSFGYDNANRRTSLTYPNGVVTTYAYDNVSRLTNLGAALGGTTITSFGYTHDAAGNRTSKVMPEFTESYGYDALYRLTEVARTGGETGETFYSYDPVGNRLTEQVGQTITKSVYDSGNRLVSTSGGGPLKIRGHLNEPGTATVNGQAARILAGNVFDATINAVPGANTVTVMATDLSGNATTRSWTVTVPTSSASSSYDANGNLTSKTDTTGTWTYEWNAENQLTRVLKNAVEQARFAYDPIGRRVEKVAGTTTTAYLNDGEDILRETVNGAATTYIHGPGIDEPLTREDGAGSRTYYHADGLGSLTKETNSAGALTLTRKYDASGNLQLGANSGYAFTGREWDSEIGLAYYRARYYDPKIGRFLSEDPLRWKVGPNYYVYADNNPATLVDPLGLTPSAQRGDPGPCLAAIDTVLLLLQTVHAGATPDKVGHCLAHCYLIKNCGNIGPAVSAAGGPGKEALDELRGRVGSAAAAMGFKPPAFVNPNYFWDGGDTAANEQGRYCPANVSCWERCKDAQNYPVVPAFQ